MSIQVTARAKLLRLFDEIRGKLPAREFKNAFVALIFLRWADFEEAENEAIAAFEDVDYQRIRHAQFRWEDLHTRAHELRKTIVELPSIVWCFENSRNHMIATAANYAAPAIEKLSQLPIEVATRMIEWIADLPFETPADRIAIRDLLDDVLRNYRDKYANEFSTPSQIAALMAGLVKPRQGEHIYDPCFGSAGLLTSALDNLGLGKNVRLDNMTDPALRIAGTEINFDTFVIGATRLGLSGAVDSHLFCGDSLRDAELHESLIGVDVVLANPPWGMKIDLQGQEERYPIPTKDSTSLFLQHSLSKLRTGGRCVMVVPPSLLFRGGRERRLREWLLNENRVEAIIGLPKGEFNHTAIETCIMLIRKGGSTERVRMIKLKLDKNENDARPKGSFLEYDEIVEAVQSSNTDGLHSWDVTISEIAENDYDLTPKRRDRSDLESILKSIPKGIEVRSLSDCCDVLTGKSIRSNDLQDERPKPEKQSAETTNPDDLLPLKELEARMQELNLAIEELETLEDSERIELRRNELLKELTELQIQSLQHVAELTKDRPAVPYIRIKDIDRSSVTRGSSWVKPLVALTLQPKVFLGAGDILLSKSGTIGKAGVVRDGAVGGVAANGLFVLRVKDETIDPQYLLAFLQGTEAKLWMEDRSRGSASKYLSSGAIKDLPVALPALQIQRRTAEQHLDYGVDALTYLVELLSEDHSSSLPSQLNEWVATNTRLLDADEVDPNSNAFLETLESIARSECPVQWCDDCGMPFHEVCRNCDGNTENVDILSEQSPLVSWAFKFQMVIDTVRNVTSIPDDSFLYGMLQSTSKGLLSSLDQIEGHLPNEEKARELTEELGRRIGLFNSALLNRTKIIIDVGDSAFANSEPTVAVKVTNQGNLPLNDLEFRVDAKIRIIGHNRFAFLARNESLELTLAKNLDGHSDASDSLTNELDFSLEWIAHTIAGSAIHETRELTVDFGYNKANASNDSSDASEPLKHSPYITGSPVKSDRDDVFVGREQLLDDIRHQIGYSGNVVLLEGNRRAGKSSVLWHLEGIESIPGWIGVYVSFQGTEGDREEKAKGIPTVEVFRSIALETAKTLQRIVGSVVAPNGSELGPRDTTIVDLVREGIRDDAPFTYFRAYIEVLLKWLQSRDLRLLLLFDEFDKLQVGIDSKVTSPQVPENLRFLLQSESRLTAILTSMKRFRRIREEYFSALYGLGTPFDVSSLTQEDAESLVTKPVKGQLFYAPTAIARLVYLVAQQPYLLQCLCESVFRQAKSTNVRSITTDHVNRAAEDVLRNRHFNDLFKYAGTDRRRFILALCHREADGPDVLRLPVLREKLSAHGIDVTEEDLIVDLEWLTDLELLDFSGANHGEKYSLTVPLMGLWIDTLDYLGLMSKARAESAETEDKDDE